MIPCQKISELLSGYLDNELTQGDQQRVQVHLKSCYDCRRELDDLGKLRGAVAKSLPRSELENPEWEKIMNDMPAGVSRGVGWILLIAGVVTLVVLAVWEFAIDDEISMAAKLGVAAVWFGLLFLFLSVLRQRLLSWKTDKYKNVKY
jgi:predicted anti-sigma-YlaC factor YlaD